MFQKKSVTKCVPWTQIKSQCNFITVKKKKKNGGKLKEKKVLLEVTKTETLACRVRGAQAPAGARGQRPRRDFLGTIVCFLCWMVLHYHGNMFSIKLFPFSFSIYSFPPPISCSIIAKEVEYIPPHKTMVRKDAHWHLLIKNTSKCVFLCSTQEPV